MKYYQLKILIKLMDNGNKLRLCSHQLVNSSN